MKKLYHEDLTEQQATTLVIQALYDAADDDSATGGPDVARRIFPIVTVITEDGFRRARPTRSPPRSPARSSNVGWNGPTVRAPSCSDAPSSEQTCH